METGVSILLVTGASIQEAGIGIMVAETTPPGTTHPSTAEIKPVPTKLLSAGEIAAAMYMHLEPVMLLIPELRTPAAELPVSKTHLVN